MNSKGNMIPNENRVMNSRVVKMHSIAVFSSSLIKSIKLLMK